MLIDSAGEHTIFSSICGPFTKVNHCVEQEISPDKFQRILIIENIYPDQNEIKINNKSICKIFK